MKAEDLRKLEESIKHSLFHDYSWNSKEIDNEEFKINDVIECTIQQFNLTPKESNTLDKDLDVDDVSLWARRLKDSKTQERAEELLKELLQQFNNPKRESNTVSAEEFKEKPYGCPVCFQWYDGKECKHCNGKSQKPIIAESGVSAEEILKKHLEKEGDHLAEEILPTHVLNFIVDAMEEYNKNNN